MPAPTLVLGAPCWIDLYSSDTERASDFYGRLFGWTTLDPGPEYGGYFIFHKDGKAVAGCMRNDGAEGWPDAWTVYLHTDDVPLLEWVPAGLQLFLGRNNGDVPEVDHTLDDGDEVSVGTLSLEVVHTPGHSPGSICLVSPGDGVVFSGDTLFEASIGRTDLPGGDTEQLIASIKKRLFPLGDLHVFPGHGGPTTLERERYENPFVGEWRA